MGIFNYPEIFFENMEFACIYCKFLIKIENV